MSKYIISLGFFLGSIAENTFAQSIVPIQLDRPDQTECPFIVPKGYIQVENGFTFEKIDNNTKTINFPTALWKYGVNEKFELRLITETAYTKQNTETNIGLMPITVGFKSSLCEEKGLMPKTSFIGHLTTSNVGSKTFHTAFVAPSFRFTMQHTLTEKVALAYNIGAEWDGENATPTYIYTLTTGVSLTNRLGAYAELYGFIGTKSSTNHRADGGFTYLVSNNFMVDISGGVGLTNNAPKQYVSLGVSYRFRVKAHPSPPKGREKESGI